jgi:hypothetical protein
MTNELGMPEHVLDDIETRLLGADHRPWVLSTPQGVDVMCDGGEFKRRLTLFYAGDDATDEMLEFVAHAPRDVEILVAEVRTLKKMLSLCKESRVTAVGELQAVRVAASRAEEKIVDIRRAWKDLHREMGSKP